MGGTSTKSRIVAVRVPNSVYDRLVAEAAHYGVRLSSVMQRRLAAPSFDELISVARSVTPASPGVIPWPGTVSTSDSVGG